MAAPGDTIKPGTVMHYQDLRDFIAIADALGELRVAEGVDRYLEIGALCTINRERDPCPTILCDRFPGFAPGFRILLDPNRSLNRSALTYGLPLGLTRGEYARLGREKGEALKRMPPRVVADGPILENVQEGDNVDLTIFPFPHWHEGDGGAYPGTAVAVITRDPESDWVNIGAYRVMYQDPTHVSIYISSDGHGRLHRERYFKRGEACPVAISLGHDPLLFTAAASGQPEGVGEYDYMGGIRGEPVEVIMDPHTRLPIPARAELVLVGEIRSDDIRPEGPFGEVFGYYASGIQERPAVTVKAVYYRNQPIILGNPPSRPPHEKNGETVRLASGESVIDRVRKTVGGVKDVFSGYPAGSGQLAVISIQQQFPGHAMQAGLTMANSAGHRPRYVIVVDEDVDIRNPVELLWAVTTRTDPIKDIHVIPRTASSETEPAIPPWEGNMMSRCILDATRPYEWIDKFPKTVDVSPELRERVLGKWKEILS